MKNNYYFPVMLMIGMLFTGFSSFSQSVNSLNQQQKKDAAYIQAQQEKINNGVQPEVKTKNTGTSIVSTSPKKDAGVASVQETASPNYVHARSIIYSDARTPRYAVTGDKAIDQANYDKAKQVWMTNNPQQNAAPAKTEEQLRERQENNK